MSKNIAETVIPADSVLNGYFHRVDYQDCFLMDVQKEGIELNDVVRCFFTQAPAWITKLMKLRDKLAGKAGLRTNESISTVPPDPHTSSFQPGEKFGLFQILERNDKEVIMGSDDRHLNFRVSIFMDQQQQGPQKRIFISTVAVLHNWMGRSYMKMVAPFHKLVVPTMMSQIRKGILQL